MAIKAGFFVLEGLNALATTYYFYYLFFLMEKQFGFGNLGNLFLAACNGFFYMFAAWFGGRFAQRRGYFRALTIGFSVMAAALLVGAIVPSAAGQFLVMLVWTLGMCFTWPTLEALASEGESGAGLQKMIGIYNLVWAGCGAVAYLAGGWLFDHLGFTSIFLLPAGIHLIQLGLLFVLAQRPDRTIPSAVQPRHHPTDTRHRPSADHPAGVAPTVFLQMAWLANPFAYVAINTVVAVIPGLARQFNLSPTWVGVFCSIWFFARLATFLLLWHWTGWHYRFRWFLGAFLLIIAAFTVILNVPSLTAIVVAQIFFGGALGLIYYSSLFYSMDVGETKGEHGGLHEAAIGVGIFLGPATGAAALYLCPASPGAGPLAVAGLLVCGLAGVIRLRIKGTSGRPANPPGPAV